MHCTDPGDGGSVGRTSCFPGTEFEIQISHIILNGDFPLVAKNEVTQVLEVVPFEEKSDDLKKKIAKNNEAKMVLYNALPKKEYERIFMCKTAKDIWQSLLITHQGNSQVKDNKIDLLVQQYEQFTILEEESIDSGFARFNTIITSLKALDEGFSSKNYVRKFLRALHPKWRAKVTAIEESKDLSSLALDELIGNLKVHEVSHEKRFRIYKGKKERVKSIPLKAKKESSDNETSTFGSDDEENQMAVWNFKKFFRRKRKFVRQTSTDHGREFDNEIQFRAFCDAQGITNNLSAPRTPQSNGVVERKNRTLQEMSRTVLDEQSIPQKFWCNVVDTSTYILDIILIRPILGKTPYEIYTVEESLNVIFDQSTPPTKLSPLVNDDVGEEEAIENKIKEACSFMLCDLDFEPLSLSLSSLPSCDLVSLTNILILCLILKASNQSLRKSLSLKSELS
ncbi:zf-CCHC domain-containing protein [Tanacetum coccineum]